MSDEKNKMQENIENQNVARKNEPEVGEDSTKYGEFISTYFAWIPLPEQKANAERLQNITKKDKKERNK